MLKRSFLLIVIFGIILQCFGSFLIVCHYQWNKKIIAERLCENRNKPKSTCHGKCHLRKLLVAQEKREQVPVSPLKGKTEVNQYFEEHVVSVPSNFVIALENGKFLDPNLNPLSVIRTIFHPPC